MPMDAKNSGHYYRTNFREIMCYLRDESSPNIRISIDDNQMERSDFLRFVYTIYVENSLSQLRIASNMDLLNSLTTLRSWYINFDEQFQLHGFQNVQKNVESIELIGCTITDNFVNEFLSYCPKLKSLQISNVKFSSLVVETNLFQRNFPTLENLDYKDEVDVVSLSLLPFLGRNPNVKCLHIMANDFLNIPLNKTTIHLDYLNIDIIEYIDANDLANRLTALYANGFF